MQFPIIILSYGDFAESKKLFFYEDQDILLFPVFTDPANALEFQKQMQRVLAEQGDDRPLITQVCEEPKYAKDMLVMISCLVPELSMVIFDPSFSQRRLVGRNIKKHINEVIDDIDQGLS